MNEKHREPEVAEERVPGIECLDGHARITSKELAPIHSVKSGILQNACSTRPTVVAELGKSARMHIVRLMNNLVKGPEKNGDKSAVAMLKKYELHDRTGRLVKNAYSSNTRQIGLRISGCGAAEVFIDFTEELRHAETNPSCKIHESYCTSH